jgi:hypothetical protein
MSASDGQKARRRWRSSDASNASWRARSTAISVVPNGPQRQRRPPLDRHRSSWDRVPVGTIGQNGGVRYRRWLLFTHAAWEFLGRWRGGADWRSSPRPAPAPPRSLRLDTTAARTFVRWLVPLPARRWAPDRVTPNLPEWAADLEIWWRPLQDCRGTPKMADDLPCLIRATFKNAVLTHRDARMAFERAVGIVLGRQPRASLSEARERVAIALAGEPAGWMSDEGSAPHPEDMPRRYRH